MKLLQTGTTPYVCVDPDHSKIVIKGRSSPQSSIDFYFPVIEEILRLGYRTKQVTADFELEYFNTSSCKCLMNLFKALSTLSTKDFTVKVNWIADEDDIDIIEAGEDFEDLCGLTFNYIYTA